MALSFGGRRGRVCAAIFVTVSVIACVSANHDPAGTGETDMVDANMDAGRQLLASCKPGYERVSGKCISCRPGYAKSVAGNYRCSKCPGNSIAAKRATAKCTKCSGLKPVANASKTACRATECRDLRNLPKNCLPAGLYQDTCSGCRLIPGPLPQPDSPDDRDPYAFPDLKCASCKRSNGTYRKNVAATIPTQGFTSPLLTTINNPVFNCDGRLRVGGC